VSLFSFSGVGLVTDGHRRLDGVDAEIPDGAITVVVGPSGSGKSSLLRLCNRLEAPSEGRVCFRGQDLEEVDVREHRRTVGMLFQHPIPFAGTVGQNLAVADPGADGARCRALLTRVGLGPDLLDRPADRLSGGEAQRMCLARTLATDPQVLLADEATSSLDPAATRRLEDLARELRQDGLPVVWVTQELEQIARLADHVLVVLGGRVLPADDPRAAAFLDGGS
jgi:putative ABC transport system ATP-binding protein